MESLLVCIPVFNSRPYISEAIESVLNQSYQHFKLLVIDDGSSDGSAEVIQKYLDERIVFIRHTNRGVSAVMNEAIEFASQNGYSYLARMDSDDISLPQRLEKQMGLLQNHPQAAACSANCHYVEESGKKIIGSSTIPASSGLIKREINNGLRGMVQGACIFKIEALTAVGGYRQQFPTSEDTDIFLRLSERYPLVNSPEYLYKIRLRKNSLSTGDLNRSISFTFYALNCASRRKHNLPESSYEDFLENASLLLKMQIWKEKKVLTAWRSLLTGGNKLNYLVALILDPNRVFSRIRRYFDSSNLS